MSTHRINAVEVANRAALYFKLNSDLRSADRCDKWPDETPCISLLRDQGGPLISEREMCPACKYRYSLHYRVRKAQRSLYRAAKSWGDRAQPNGQEKGTT